MGKGEFRFRPDPCNNAPLSGVSDVNRHTDNWHIRDGSEWVLVNRARPERYTWDQQPDVGVGQGAVDARSGHHQVHCLTGRQENGSTSQGVNGAICFRRPEAYKVNVQRRRPSVHRNVHRVLAPGDHWKLGRVLAPTDEVGLHVLSEVAKDAKVGWYDRAIKRLGGYDIVPGRKRDSIRAVVEIGERTDRDTGRRVDGCHEHAGGRLSVYCDGP